LAPVGGSDGIEVVPSFDARCRAREFWLKHRRRWAADVRRAARSAGVVHVSAVDVYQPLAFVAYDAVRGSDAVRVVVGPDMDPHVVMRPTLRGRLYCLAFDHLLRRAVRRADLAFLKEGCVYERYARHAANARSFCHSMHADADVIAEEALEARLRTLSPRRPLRAAYAGRFVARKGLRDAVSAVAEAKRLGVGVELHLFGRGPEEEPLRQWSVARGVQDRVHFRGVLEYGAALFSELARFDLLLFMPSEEDTPRMLFD